MSAPDRSGIKVAEFVLGGGGPEWDVIERAGDLAWRLVVMEGIVLEADSRLMSSVPFCLSPTGVREIRAASRRRPTLVGDLDCAE